MHPFSPRALLLAGALITVIPLAPAAEMWEPQKTWVFAVGVLQFDDPEYTTWPDAGRLDVEMLEAYKERGVPKEQILFIKNKQATKQNIIERLREFAAKASPDDTFIFYYAGHGDRDYDDPARPVSFVTYDTERTWKIQNVFKVLEKHFPGKRAILTTDCCHSGALSLEAAKRNGKISYGVITSSQASATSTGNWTFTQTLIDLLRGNPVVDLNGNGLITFAEAAKYCDAEMAFTEGQRASEAISGDFSSGLILAKTKGSRAPRVGENCEARWKGKWWKAKILEANADQVRIRWVQDDGTRPWIANDQVRPYRAKTFPAGTKVEIEWDKKWCKGNVVKSELGLMLVHYDGFSKIDDEWVPMVRLRER